MQGYTNLRFDLKHVGKNYFAQYSDFTVEDELSSYQLVVGEYKGTAGDSLTEFNGNVFYIESPNYPHFVYWWSTSSDYTVNGPWGLGLRKRVMWSSLGWTSSLSSTEVKVRQV